MSTRTAHPIILRDLAQLGEYFDHDAAGDEPADIASQATIAAPPRSDVAAVADAPIHAGVPRLLELLTKAGADLARLVQQDQAARQAARGLLDRYEGLCAQRQEAEAVLARAERLRQEAAALAEDAFADEARAEAASVAALAVRAVDAATRLAEERRAELAVLAAEPAIARLLAERRREEERRDAEAAEAECARRLAEGLAAVRGALAAGDLQEAEAMLGFVAKLCPDSADVASLNAIIRQRAEAVKVDRAEAALRDARRQYRHAPAEAIARLERVELAGLPDALARQLKGVWAAACARVCQERQLAGLFRYLPRPGFGVVVAREPAGAYRVVSALGGDAHWRPGETVAEADLRGAHPLRATGR